MSEHHYRTFLEIFRTELEAKREAAEKKKHFVEYRPDQEALEKFGYDLNDPGFVASQTTRRYGEMIFKNLSPDDLRRDTPSIWPEKTGPGGMSSGMCGVWCAKSPMNYSTGSKSRSYSSF